MLNILYSTFNSDVVTEYFKMDYFDIKDYVLLINDMDDGHTFKYSERNKVGYNENSNIDDVVRFLNPVSDVSIDLVGNGYGSLTMSENATDVDLLHYEDAECSIVKNATDEDIINNIPFYKDILVLDINGYKEFSHKRPETVLSKIKELHCLVKADKSPFVIYKRERTLYYF